MALFVRQDESRSELQDRVASDLKARLNARAMEPADEHEPTILEGQHQTRTIGVAITILLLVLFVAVVWWLLKLGGIF
jgi:hypothetical protein